jgi:hypothetical protein
MKNSRFTLHSMMDVIELEEAIEEDGFECIIEGDTIKLYYSGRLSTKEEVETLASIIGNHLYRLNPNLKKGMIFY